MIVGAGLVPNGTGDNGTTAMYDFYPHERPWVIELLFRIYLVALPVICVTGIVGNSLAFFIFVSKPMRRTSCSWYLATRSVSDGGFLLATFITWSSDATKLNYFHTNGICQVTIFSTFIFAFISVWMTVVITCENFIRICRPFSVSKFCNVRKAKISTAGLIFISLLMYNYPLWTNKVYERPGYNMTYCHTQPMYAKLTKWLSFWDLLITLVIPSLVIVTLMIFITASLVHSIQRQNRLQGQGRSQRSNGEAGGGHNEANNHVRSRSNSPQAKVTWMLFAVSLLFILLNSPLHIIRTKMVVVELVYGPSHTPTAEHKIQVIFQIIYYLSFGVNLLVYLACGDNFRKIFKETYLKTCLRSQRNCASNEMTALTTVRLDETEAANTRTDHSVSVRFHPDTKQSTTSPPDDEEEIIISPTTETTDDKSQHDHFLAVREVNGNSTQLNHREEKEDEKNLINLQTTDL